MDSNTSIPYYVESRILFDEKTKRPQLYKEALKTVLENFNVVSAHTLKSLLDKKFLRMVFGEAIIRKPRLQAKLISESYSEGDSNVVKYLGLTNLRIYSRIIRNELTEKLRVSEDDIFNIEESFRYNVVTNDIEKAKRAYLSKLLFLSDENVDKAELFNFLNLASEPSVYEYDLSIDVNTKNVALWPYIISLRTDDGTCEIRAFGKNVVKCLRINQLVEKGEKESFKHAEPKPLGEDAFALVYKSNSKHKALIFRLDPYGNGLHSIIQLVGLSIVYSRSSKLFYVLDNANGTPQLKVYNVDGILIFSKDISKEVSISSSSIVYGYECLNGAMFIIQNQNRKSSQIIYYDFIHKTFLTREIESQVDNVIALPLYISILYSTTRGELIVLDVLKNEIIRSYKLPIQLSKVFLVNGGGVVGFADDKIYLLDGLGNVYKAIEIRGYDKYSILNTYAYALLCLYRKDKIDKILIFHDNTVMEISASELISDEIVDIQYSNTTIYLMTKHYILAMSPSVLLKYIVEKRVINPLDYIHLSKLEEFLGNLHLQLSSLKSLNLDLLLEPLLSKYLKILKLSSQLSMNVLELFLEETSSVVKRLELSCQDSKYLISSILEDNADIIKQDFLAFIDSFVKIGDFLKNVRKPGGVEDYARGFIRILPFNELLNLGKLLEKYLDPATIKNIRKALLYLLSEPRYAFIKSDIYGMLNLFGMNLQFIEVSIGKIVNELNNLVDEDVVKKLKTLFENAIYQGDAESINKSINNMLIFTEYLREKLSLAEKSWNVNLLSYTDVKNLVNECVTEIFSNEKKVKECENGLEAYIQVLKKIHEIYEDLNAVVRKSRYVKIDLLRFIRDFRSLSDGYDKIVALNEKVKQIISLENDFNYLLSIADKLEYKPSLEVYISKCRDSLEKLRYEDTEQCLRLLRDKLERIHNINENIKALSSSSASKCSSVVLVINDIIDRVKQDMLDEALNKVETLKKVINICDSAKPLINNLSNNLTKIGVDVDTVSSLCTRLECYIADEIYYERAKVQEILRKIGGLTMEVHEVINKVNVVAPAVKSLVGRLKEIGVSDKIAVSLETSFHESVKRLLLEALKACHENLNICFNVIGNLNEKLDTAQALVININDNLYRLITSYELFTEGFSQIILQKMSKSFEDKVHQDFFEVIYLIKDILDTTTKKRDIIKELALIEKQISDVKLVSNMGRQMFDYVKNSVQQNLMEISDSIMSERGDIKTYLEKCYKLHRLLENLITKLVEIDRMGYEFESHGVNVWNVIRESYMKLENQDLDELSNNLHMIHQSLNDLYSKLKDPELLGLALVSIGRLDHDTATFLKLVGDLTNRFNIEKSYVIRILKDHIGETNLEDYMGKVLEDLSIYIVERKFGIEVSDDLSRQAVHHLMFIDYTSSEELQEGLTKCDNIARMLDNIKGFASKAIESYCYENNIKKATTYGLLSYTGRERHFPLVFNLLGGVYKNKLTSLIRGMHTYLNAYGFNRQLMLLECLSKPFIRNKHDEIEEYLKKLRYLYENIQKVSILMNAIHSGRDESASRYFVDRLFKVYEILANPNLFIKKYGAEHVKVIGHGVIDPNKESSEIAINVVNTGSIPITIKDIRVFIPGIQLGSSTEEEVVEPHSSKVINVTISKIPLSREYMNEAWLNLALQAELVIKLDTLYRHTFSTTIGLPVKTSPHKEILRKLYDEIKRKISKSIYLGDVLEESFLTAGHHNVILSGYHREEKRKVVIKIPRISLAVFAKIGYTLPSLSWKEHTELFQRIKDYLDASKACENVASIYELSIEPPYIVEEYLQGKTLREWMGSKGKLDSIEALKIVYTIGKTVKCLHKYNVYHNDIRPDNVIITEDGKVFLIDIGADEIFRKIFKSYYSLVSRDIELAVEDYYVTTEVVQELNNVSDINEETALRRNLDVLQLSILLYELIMGYNPNLAKVYQPIHGLSKKLNDVIRILLLRERETQITIDDFLKLLEESMAMSNVST